MNRCKLIRRLCCATLCALTAWGAASCNKDSKDDTPDTYETAPSVAVNSFSLKADSKVLQKLDSVFFSIDLEHKVIFNADSLPKGTDVTRLIPVISFAADVTSAHLTFSGADGERTTDYKKNPSDSIDFTHPVSLSVATSGDKLTATYTLKVNVHRNDPDTVIWTSLARTSLPSRMPKPLEQKTVQYSDKAVCIVAENDGSYTLSRTGDLFAQSWTKNPVTLPAPVRLRTLQATPSALWVLGTDGTLYTSADGETWTSTGQVWINTTGAYGDILLGIGGDAATGLRHVHWPATAGMADTPLEAGFPVSGQSALWQFTTPWSPRATALTAGGRLADGTLTDAAWAFDGTSWTRLDIQSFPALEEAVMVPYHAYRKTAVSWIQKEFDVWLLLGGRLSDGTPNRTVYLSYDNGIHWAPAPALMQLPDFLTPGAGADGLVARRSLTADLADAWTRCANPARRAWMRTEYRTDGYEITWECPYIFLFGGRNASGTLSDLIWTGVLARLTYAPLM